MKEQTLLTKILIFIDERTVHLVKNIADKLAMSTDLVYHIFMSLEQTGFLKSLNPSPGYECCRGCTGNCTLCARFTPQNMGTHGKRKKR